MREAVNAELKRVILERERKDEGVQHSNLGGWQSSWDFESWGGPGVQGGCSMRRASSPPG